MTTAAQFRVDPQHTDHSWLAIVRRHHEAKALARCGRREQAQSLLRDALPPLIRQWGRMSGLPRHLQILRLRKLLQGDLAKLMPQKPRRLPSAISRPAPQIRIPLADISGMIDAVHLSEAQAEVHPSLRLAS